MITIDERLRDEAVELLQTLVRNRCVNDGTPGSGNETRSAEDIRDYLSVPGGPDMELLAPSLTGARWSCGWRAPTPTPRACA